MSEDSYKAFKANMKRLRDSIGDVEVAPDTAATHVEVVVRKSYDPGDLIRQIDAEVASAAARIHDIVHGLEFKYGITVIGVEVSPFDSDEDRREVDIRYRLPPDLESKL